MNMDKLEGVLNKENGNMKLTFEAWFDFTIANFIKFPNLIIKTNLGTNYVQSKLHSAQGKCLQNDGKLILVGIAKVNTTGNMILDSFLGLPNEALAILKCHIE